MDQCLLSIVIPNLNGSAYLEETILSALKFMQGINNFEIIVSDNYSTDDSKNIILKYAENNVRLVLPERRLSIGGNWSFVTAQAKGKYVKFLGADDLQIDFLIKEVDILESEPEAVALVSRRKIIDGTGQVILKSRGVGKELSLISGDRLINQTWMSGTNLIGDPTALMFRRENLLSALPWEDESFPYVVDLSLYIKCFPRKKVMLSKNTVSSFRIHAGSVTGKTLGGQAQQFYGLFLQYLNQNYEKRSVTVVKKFRVLIMAYLKQIAKIVFVKLYVRKEKTNEK